MESVDDASDEDTVKYFKITNEIKSKQYEIRAFM
jgi:hypothetical protein